MSLVPWTQSLAWVICHHQVGCLGDSRSCLETALMHFLSLQRQAHGSSRQG